ncbi:DHHC palmitoyltransferase-domain-containing protein [Cunninghamella echinulata]|nr:DHHC palmitoyltransferase-domain-containing protein [Cunninghamella echinulata]
MFDTINGKYIVIGVSGLISFLFITVQWGVIYPIITEWTFMEKVKLLGPINIGAFLLSYNYYLAIVTDPGKVPDGWEPPYSLIHQLEQVQINNGETGPRYCRTCEAYKPPRSHHCRVCKRCVLKMDHHCPWINNCVGYGNYPHFFRFVFFVNLTCGYAFVLLIWRLYLILDTNNIINLIRPITISEMVLLVLDFVATFIVVFCVGILGIYHTYCLLKGQTTIEGSERSKVRRLIRKRKIMPVEFPFDLGIRKNITSVLGSNPLLWLLPQPVIGDGLTFPIKPNTGKSILKLFF